MVKIAVGSEKDDEGLIEVEVFKLATMNHLLVRTKITYRNGKVGEEEYLYQKLE